MSGCCALASGAMHVWEQLLLVVYILRSCLVLGQHISVLAYAYTYISNASLIVEICIPILFIFGYPHSHIEIPTFHAAFALHGQTVP
jgi:hypothetical protein